MDITVFLPLCNAFVKIQSYTSQHIYKELVSYKVMWLLHSDPILGKGRCQIFHGQAVTTILPLTCLTCLRGPPCLTMLQCIIGNIRHKLLGSQRHQANSKKNNSKGILMQHLHSKQNSHIMRNTVYVSAWFIS